MRRLLTSLVLVSSLAAVAALYQPVTWLVDTSLLRLRDNILQNLEATLGRRISYSRILPSVAQGLEIEEFRVSDGSGTDLVRAKRLVVRYDLANVLLQGAFPVSEVVLQEASVTLRETEDRDILEFLIDFVSRKGLLPPITIRGEKVRVGLEFQDFDVQAAEIDFRFDNLVNFFDFSLDGGVSGEIRGALPLKRFSTRVSARGRFDPAFQDANLDLSLQDFDSDVFLIRSQDVKLFKLGSQFNLRTIKNAQPFDLEVTFDPETPSWSLFLIAERFRLSNLMQLKRVPTEWEPLLLSQFSGQFFLSHGHGEGQGLDYWIRGTLTIPGLPHLGRTSLELDSHGTDRKAIVTRAVVSASGLEGSFTGTIAWDTVWTVDGGLSVDRLIGPRGRTYSGRLEFASVRQGEMTLSGRVEETGHGRGITLGGRILQEPTVQTFELAVQGDVTGSARLTYFPATDVLSGNAVVDNLRPTFLLDQVGWGEGLPSGWLEEWRTSLQVSLLVTPDRSVTLLFAVRAQESSLPTRAIELQGQIVDRTFGVDLTRLILDDYTARGRFEGRLEDPLLTVRFDLDVNQVSYRGIVRGDLASGLWQLVVGNAPILTVRIYQRALEADWSFESFPIPLDPLTLRVSSSGALFFDSTRSVVESLEASLEIRIGQLFNMRDLSLALEVVTAAPNDFDIRDLRYSDNFSGYVGSGRLVFHGPSDFALDLGARSETDRSLLLSLGSSEEGFTLQGLVMGLDLRRFYDNNFEGLLDAQVQARLVGTETMARGLAQLHQARFGNDPLQAAVKFQIGNNRLRLTDLEVNYLNVTVENGSLEVDLETGSAALEARARGRFNRIPWSTSVRALVETNQEIGFGRDLLGVERILGSVSLTRTLFDNRPQADFTLTFSKIRSITTFRGGENNFLVGRFTDEGDFRILLGEPFLIKASLEGKLVNGVVNARVQNLVARPELVNTLISASILKVLRGSITADFEVRGLVTDPTFHGSIEFAGLYAQIPAFKGIVGPIDTTLRFEDNGLFLPPTHVASGGGELRVEGTISFARWVPDRYSLSVQIDPDHPVGVDYRFSVVVLNGSVAGRLDVSGNLFYARAQGDLELSDSTILIGTETTSEDFPFPLDLDLSIRSGNRLMFVWPLAEFPVIRAYISPRQEVHYRSQSLQGVFQLTGGILIRGGEIFYLGQVFYLSEGELRLNENQNRFDPYLSLNAELRTRDNTGPVTVLLTVSDFLSRFTPRFSSSPPRSTDEINALVGGILVPERYTQEGWQGALNLVGDFGSNLVLRPFENVVRSTLGLDMFSIRTQILNKFLLNQFTAQSPSLQDYLDNTSVFWGKYLSENIFFEGLFFLSGASQPLPGAIPEELRPRLELGLEMKTPLMLIRWQFVPESPSRLFIPDNTIFLNWRWTY